MLDEAALRIISSPSMKHVPAWHLFIYPVPSEYLPDLYTVLEVRTALVSTAGHLPNGMCVSEQQARKADGEDLGFQQNEWTR